MAGSASSRKGAGERFFPSHSNIHRQFCRHYLENNAPAYVSCRRWAVAFALFSLVSFFDVVAVALSAGKGLRLARPLRPLLVTAHVRRFRQARESQRRPHCGTRAQRPLTHPRASLPRATQQLAGSFLRMAPWLWDVLALASVLIVSFAVVGVQLLGGVYTVWQHLPP